MAAQSTVQEKPATGFAAPARRGRSRRLHALILLGALLVPLLGATMSLEPRDRVSLPGMRGHPLPTICVSRQFGLECATCGVTRSIIALMHGRWAQSLGFHRFGWLIALVIVTQVPYRLYRIFRPIQRLPAVEACGLALLAMTLVLLLGNWLFQLLGWL